MPGSRFHKQNKQEKQEMNAVLLIIVIFLLCFIVEPSITMYLHALFSTFLFMIRMFEYWTKKHERWLMIDIIYGFHILLAIHMFAFPLNIHLFYICWIFSIGLCPILSILWTDCISLSFSAFISFYFRFMPVLLMFALKSWTSKKMKSIQGLQEMHQPLSSTDMKYIENMMDNETIINGTEFHSLTAVLFCIAFLFFCHSLQFIAIMVFMKKSETKVSFKYLANRGLSMVGSFWKNSQTFRPWIKDPGNTFALFWIVFALHIIVCVCIAAPFSVVIFYFSNLHLLLIAGLFGLGCYRGMLVFAKRIRDETIASKKRK